MKASKFQNANTMLQPVQNATDWSFQNQKAQTAHMMAAKKQSARIMPSPPLVQALPSRA